MAAVARNPRREPSTSTVIKDESKVKARPKKKVRIDKTPDAYNFILTITHQDLLFVNPANTTSEQIVSSYMQVNVPEINLEFVLHHDDTTIQIIQRILRLRNKIAFRDTERDSNYRANVLDLNILNLLRELSLHTSISDFLEVHQKGYRHDWLMLTWSDAEHGNDLTSDPI